MNKKTAGILGYDRADFVQELPPHGGPPVQPATTSPNAQKLSPGRLDYSPDQARDEGGRFAAGGGGGSKGGSGHPSARAAGEPAHDVHASSAVRSAAQAEKHAQVLRAAAQHTKDPEHGKMAKKAEMHAKMARESADKAAAAKTPVVAAHHAAAAEEHSEKAGGIREHLKRAAEKAMGRKSGAHEEGEERQGEGNEHHIVPWKELWDLLVGQNGPRDVH